jgi:hypothetical protein
MSKEENEGFSVAQQGAVGCLYLLFVVSRLQKRARM